MQTTLAVALQLVYLQRLIMRIPDTCLGGNARFYRNVLVAFYALITISQLFAQLGKDSPTIVFVVGAILVIAIMGAVPFEIGFLVFLWQLGTRLAKEIWLE